MDQNVRNSIDDFNNENNPVWQLDKEKFDAPSTPKFATIERAYQWMVRVVDDPYIDNCRFAYTNDGDMVSEYEKAMNNGCCGSFDHKIVCRNREAIIGCNYGH